MLTTLPPSCAVVMKSRNLNFLETCGLLQACNGTALPFYLHGLIMCGIVIKIETVIVKVSTLILKINKYVCRRYSRRMRWEGHVARMGQKRGVYRVLVGKPEGRRPLGRPRRRWENDIKMDLQDVGCGDMDWIELAQDRNR